MSEGRLILDSKRFRLTIERLCHHLIERYDDFQNACLIAIQAGGTPLADRMHHLLLEILDISHIEYGKLDITFYRDDFRTRSKPFTASPTQLNFPIENKQIILVDDVLYTGRTVQAAMTALNDYGRPATVEMVAMIDRRFNRHLPIRTDYAGMRVDAIADAYVKVEWEEIHGKDQVLLFGGDR